MDINGKEIEGALLLKYISEKASPEEQTQVEAWLAEDASNSDTLLQVARIYHAQRTQRRIRQRDTMQALSRVNHRIGQRLRRIILRRLAVAASLLIGLLGIGSTVWQRQNQQDELQPQMITMSTNAGIRSRLTLPDGTSVFLNAGSTIVYPSQFDRNERRVQLSGEAYFKVEQDISRPFIVSVANNGINIRALGTEFNLQAYEKDSLVQVALIEGSVQVGLQDQKEMVQLAPSNMAAFDTRTGKQSITNINIAQITSWMDGRLIFKDTPIPEVLRQLTHFYSVDFEVQNTVINGYTFTGTFENRPLFQILEYLKISSKIENTMLYPENQDVRKPVIRLNRGESKIIR